MSDTAAPAAASRTTPRGRGTKIALVIDIGVAWAIALTWLIWAAWYHANPAVRGTLVAYRVTSDHSVEVRFEIVRKPGVTAQWVLGARAADGSEVGRRLIIISPESGRHIARVEVLATTSQAINGELRECRAAPGH